MDADECDERAEELGSLEAIYPELSRTNADPYAFTLDIPVELDEPATVTFASDSGAPNTLTLRHLPALTLTMALPKGYPSTQPEVSLTTQPQWLAREHLSRLEADAPRMWEEAGREAVVCFSYVDHLQTQARELFGIGSLELSADLMAPLRDHERQQKQADFDRKAFTCGVCLGK
jgi:E3 ubiquitin-protein ligase RNF14